MRVLLINPPYQTLTSNIGVGHQVPLGLLMVGGALIDAGHEVKLLDAECRRLRIASIVRGVEQYKPDVILTGHAGSTPAHPVTMRMLRAIRQRCPTVRTVYGGVFPTYHALDILRDEPSVDFIVRGEGEATCVELLAALESGTDPDDVAAIAYRHAGECLLTRERTPIRDLDAYRTGWELIERWDDYQCFGLGRAAIVQLSRGCPHRCTYCGQHAFWTRWRHRDPLAVADEIERLHREHDVRFITLADENPTTSRAVWRTFLETLAARKLDVHFFTTLRASDVVRDADLLPLYRKAGILYVLMGVDSTSPEVLKAVRKGSSTRDDLRACRLLREHGIFSVLGHIVGLREETPESLRVATHQLIAYGGDYLNAMYAMPHRWTPFAREMAGRPIVEPDQSRFDYRHQVLGLRTMSPARLFWSVKWMELQFHFARLPALWRTRDAFMRRQLRWTLLHVGSVWVGEIIAFVLRRPDRRAVPASPPGAAREPDGKSLVALRVMSTRQARGPGAPSAVRLEVDE